MSLLKDECHHANNIVSNRYLHNSLLCCRFVHNSVQDSVVQHLQHKRNRNRRNRMISTIQLKRRSCSPHERAQVRRTHEEDRDRRTSPQHRTQPLLLLLVPLPQTLLNATMTQLSVKFFSVENFRVHHQQR